MQIGFVAKSSNNMLIRQITHCVQRKKIYLKMSKKRKNGDILSAAAIREHNVKCRSGSVSLAILSRGKGQEEKRSSEYGDSHRQ